MVIELDKKYVIKMDKYGFILVNKHTNETIPLINKNTKKKNKRHGQPMGEEEIGYFKHLDSLLRVYVHEILRKKKEAISINELIKRYEDIFDKFNDLKFKLIK